jgi:hypothetical protein
MSNPQPGGDRVVDQPMLTLNDYARALAAQSHPEPIEPPDGTWLPLTTTDGAAVTDVLRRDDAHGHGPQRWWSVRRRQWLSWGSVMELGAAASKPLARIEIPNSDDPRQVERVAEAAYRREGYPDTHGPWEHLTNPERSTFRRRAQRSLDDVFAGLVAHHG